MASRLLSIETATDVCSVALLVERRVIVTLTLARPRAHAENLAPMISEALRLGGVEAAELEAVAVSMGPGSYTGLRIGVSTAKGLALATGAGLIGVPSLESLAAAVAPHATPDVTLCTLFNSRRNEVYAAAYRVTDKHALALRSGPVAVSVDDVYEALQLSESEAVWLVGEGGTRVGAALEKTGRPYRILDPSIFAPSAAWVGRLAVPRMEARAFDDVASFEPFYLKEFVARKPQGSAFDKLTF